MYEIRIHGRGGQGGVTTGQIMAIGSFYDGQYCQTFPMFGVERCGAPVLAFTRIDKKPIRIRSEVYEPDIAIVLDASLMKTVDVTKGLKKKGTIIINSNKTAKELGLKGNYNIHIVDATKIALEIFKRPIVNTPMLGAFAKITGLVTVKSLKKAIDEIFLKTKGPKLSDLNKKAIEAVYKATE
jgi:2-oxoacid:acceptor oxidoreductase gamma subunit (pyruvate/2-ketoisovalerate family)